ncbi:MAG: vitamin B12-dependent ribonucleotide reductase [Dehalococcoidia bacterium]|nr:vitamin B12-dependent ribonucleotide reductase [Dehalococcoidia bacterium]
MSPNTSNNNGHGAVSSVRGSISSPRAAIPDGITDIAAAVLEKRYLKRDRQGQVVENIEEMFWRVARNIAQGDLAYGASPEQAEATAREFHDLMAGLEFEPNSPTLMNAGKELQQLSACFVLPVGDSMEEIFEAVKQTALIHKSGGGTGFSFSRLRPESDIVGSTGGVASGPVSFIRAFDTATEVTKQGGTRRGANMGILNVEHPDVLRFITSKEKGDVLQNFNISVAVTERFMEAVERGEDYDLISPRTQQTAGRLNARQVFDKMVELAWKTGDPGIILIDRMNEPHSNPVPKRGPIESTNPCGEQPLYPYDSCNLGSINLARMVLRVNGKLAVDYERLGRVIDRSVHFLDNVIDMNRYPLPQIREVSLAIRRIGLGVMGWADLLIEMGIPYDSEEALRLGEEVMAFFQQRADQASEALARGRGNFPDWADSVYGPGGPFGPRPMRNSTRTTIAPTGTISIIAACSSGVEPLFALAFVRKQAGMEMLDTNPMFEQAARAKGFYSEDLMREVAQRGSCRGVPGVPEVVQRVFAASHDIAPEWHVRMQAAFQRHTDNAVSKTINFSHEATMEDVRKAYWLAYKEGCKGITIYRDRSKEEQVLNLVSAPSRQVEAAPDSSRQVGTETGSGAIISPRKRPSVVKGVTERVHTGHGTLYVTINFDEQGGPFELFSTLGKAGGCDSAQLEAISRLISLALRSGIGAEQVVDQLRGITCCPIWSEGVQVRSAVDAVAIVLSRHVPGGMPHGGLQKAAEPQGAQLGFALAPQQGKVQGRPTSAPVRCPECSGDLAYQEGCLTCHSCGYTKCG